MSPAATIENGNSFFIVARLIAIGVMIAQSPHIKIRLNIFDPTTFENAISLLPRREAERLTAISGRLVPIATTVSPMTIDETLSLFATLDAPSTKASAPLESRINPTINIPTHNKTMPISFTSLYMLMAPTFAGAILLNRNFSEVFLTFFDYYLITLKEFF